MANAVPNMANAAPDMAERLVGRMRWLLSTLEEGQKGHANSVRMKLGTFSSMWDELHTVTADLRVRQRAFELQEQQQEQEAVRLDERSRQVETEITNLMSRNATRIVEDVATRVSNEMGNIQCSSSTSIDGLSGAIVENVATRMNDRIDRLQNWNAQSLTDVSEKVINDASVKFDELKASNDRALADLSGRFNKTDKELDEVIKKFLVERKITAALQIKVHDLELKATALGTDNATLQASLDKANAIIKQSEEKINQLQRFADKGKMFDAVVKNKDAVVRDGDEAMLKRQELEVRINVAAT